MKGNKLEPCPFCAGKLFQDFSLGQDWHHPDNGCILVLLDEFYVLDDPESIKLWNIRKERTEE